MRFWTRDDKEHADWPEPRAEYVSGLADSVRQARGHIRREARRSGFTLGLAPAVILALVLAVAAFAGVSTATGAGRGVVSSLKSFIVSSSSDHVGKKGGHGHDDGDDDNHEGQYDRDCDNGDSQNQSRSLQQSDQRQLLQALTAPHPGQTARQLQLAFAAHQSAARSVSNATSDRCGGDNGGNGGGGNGGGGGGGNGGGGGGGNGGGGGGGNGGGGGGNGGGGGGGN